MNSSGIFSVLKLCMFTEVQRLSRRENRIEKLAEQADRNSSWPGADSARGDFKLILTKFD